MAEPAVQMPVDADVPNGDNEHDVAVNTDVADVTLRTLVIPFKDGQAILPNNLVVEALPFAPPIGLDHAPRWVLGTMLWKALNIPLISLEFLLHGNSAAETGTHSRIIIVQAIDNLPKLRYFGFVGSEAPRMDELQRANLAADLHPQSAPTELLSQVLVHGERAVIPDMQAIEKVLSALLNS